MKIKSLLTLIIFTFILVGCPPTPVIEEIVKEGTIKNIDIVHTSPSLVDPVYKHLKIWWEDGSINSYKIETNRNYGFNNYQELKIGQTIQIYRRYKEGDYNKGNYYWRIKLR